MPGTKAEKSAGPPSKVTTEKKRSGPKRLLTAVDHQRSEFLRRCRSRIKPEDVGLPQHRRARIGGLRREDVAALASVSVSWYTWLEQGRDIRVSDDVLERLSQTFRLTEDERTYLFSLVQQRPPRAQGERSPTAPPDVVRMLQSMNMPAIAMNMRWDVLAWNELNTAIYRDYGALPVGERNLLEILLTKPVRHMSEPSWKPRRSGCVRGCATTTANAPTIQSSTRWCGGSVPAHRCSAACGGFRISRCAPTACIASRMRALAPWRSSTLPMCPMVIRAFAW